MPAKSPAQVTEEWLATASEGQLRNLVEQLIEADVRAAVLVYQFVRGEVDGS